MEVSTTPTRRKPGPPPSMDTVGRRIILALAVLPGLERSPPGVLDPVTGIYAAPWQGMEAPKDYGTIELWHPDGRATQIPGHHYLDKLIKRFAKGDKELV